MRRAAGEIVPWAAELTGHRPTPKMHGVRLLVESLLAAGAGAVLAFCLTVADARAERPGSVAWPLPDTADAPHLGPLRLPERKSLVGPSGELSLTRYRGVLFRNLHTGEVLPLPADEGVQQAALDRFLRCRVTGEQTSMDRRPFEVASSIARQVGAQEVHVVSGYRSRRLNEGLRKKGREVAVDSQHPRGGALDFRIPELPAAELARRIAAVHRGGIGVYRGSDFVHVDTGPPRTWRGR